MSKINNLPRLIIFYGPPGSGKGTQAGLLAEELNLEFLDAGHEFRNFAKIHKKNPNSEDAFRSQRVEEYLLKGVPILTEDYLYIITKKVQHTCVEGGQTLIMDKPGGSLIPEAQWMDGLIKEKKIDVGFIHLQIPLDTVIERAANRWYVPNTKNSFISYQEAKKNCPPNTEPVQREDDKNINTIKNRYNKLYYDNKDKILEIFETNKLVKIINLDASLAIEEVHNNVINFLK